MCVSSWLQVCLRDELAVVLKSLIRLQLIIFIPNSYDITIECYYCRIANPQIIDMRHIGFS